MKYPGVCGSRLFFALFLCLSLTSKAQFVDLQLESSGLNCDGYEEITVKIKSALISQEAVELGTSSLMLNFDPEALEIINYESVEFDKTTSEKAKLAKWGKQRFTINDNFGIFNLMLLKLNGGEDHYTLSQSEYLTIGKILVKFNLDFPGASATLSANMDFTSFSNLNYAEIGLSSVPTLTLEKPNLEAQPNFSLTYLPSECGNRNGEITIRFNPNANFNTVEFSLNGGKTYLDPVDFSLGAITYDQLRVGNYSIWAKWNDNACEIQLDEIELLKVGSNAPKARFTTQAATCGDENGHITLTFEDTEGISGIEFSLDGGGSFQEKVLVRDGIVTYDGLAAGNYNIWARWENDDCPTELGTATVKNNYGYPPEVEVVKTDAICSYSNGQLTMNFEPVEGRTNIEFSLDGGNTYQRSVKLANQSVTYDELSVGNYEVWTRWGNDQCPVFVGNYEIVNQFGEGPDVTVSFAHTTCGEHNGHIQFDFLPVDGRDRITFSLDGGENFLPSMPLENGTITYGNLAAGTYHLFARWENQDCLTDLGLFEIKNNYGLPPVVEVAYEDATCGQANGVVAFSFGETAGRTNIEFSLDGGKTYKRSVRLTDGEVRYDDLVPDTYYLKARWGNNQCPVDLGAITIENQLGDAPVVEVATLNPSCGEANGSIDLSFSPQGERTNIAFSFDGGQTYLSEVALTTETFNYGNLPPGIYDIWAKWDDGTCPIQIDLVTLVDKVGNPPTADVAWSDATCGQDNGGLHFTFSEVADRTKVEFSLDGGQTYKRSVALADGGISYTDLTAGDYNVWMRWGDNDCPIEIGDFSITQVGPLAPEVIVSKSHPTCGLANGYLMTTFDPALVGEIEFSLDNGKTFQATDGATDGIFSYQDLTPGEYYVQVRYTDGTCPVDLGKYVLTNKNGLPPVVTYSASDARCEDGFGSISFAFQETAGRTKVEFSLDGGATYERSVRLDDGFVVYNELVPGTYDLWARWGDNDCPVAIGEVEILTQGVTLEQVTFTTSDASCGAEDGQIAVHFADLADADQIAISTDGGATFMPALPIAAGSVSIVGLAPGDYDLWAQVDDEACLFDLGQAVIEDMPCNALQVDHATKDLSLNSKSVSNFSLASSQLTDVNIGVQEAQKFEETSFISAQNFPNPFNNSTTISVELAKASMVEFYVYDMSGRKVMQQTIEMVTGTNQINIDGSNLAGGVYHYEMTNGKERIVKTMIKME